MPRPVMDVNGPEYQEILRGREMYRRYGSDFWDAIWAQDTLERLERKSPGFGYTDKDREDFEKAKRICARISAKADAQDHVTTHYIWRTQGDSKVRPGHGANNGKIFAWNDAPPTGHPGEDFGCRCRAEPYAEKLKEGRIQTVIFSAPDASHPWSLDDFYTYYKDEKRMKLGAPKELNTITLPQAGHMQNVIDYARTHIQPEGGSVFDRFARDICKKARQNGNGSYSENFKNKYNLTPVTFAMRTATIEGTADIYVGDRGEFLMIGANIYYSFYDRYTDPYDFADHSGDTNDEIYDDGIPYDIVGSWSTRLEAVIRKDSGNSRYSDDEFGNR